MMWPAKRKAASQHMPFGVLSGAWIYFHPIRNPIRNPIRKFGFPVARGLPEVAPSRARRLGRGCGMHRLSRP